MSHQAILLIGPTGSGKSPLGQWLERHGLWGRRCHHFDFGAQLRAASGFNPEEMRFLQQVLQQGALLEEDSFYLALRILDSFLQERRVQPSDLLIMNGLPRHIAQAEALADQLQFVAVLHLLCDAETVRERLRRNTGGDRVARQDDEPELLEKKLQIFAERTAPLVAYYRDRGVPVIRVEVAVQTQPAEMMARFHQQWQTGGSSWQGKSLDWPR